MPSLRKASRRGRSSSFAILPGRDKKEQHRSGSSRGEEIHEDEQWKVIRCFILANTHGPFSARVHSMKSLFLILCSVLAFFPLLSPAEEAAPGTPDALIHALYKTEENVFSPRENKELAAKFLAPTLIQLFVLDAKRSGDEAGAVDFDVLSFGQDVRQITKFATKSEVTGDTAVVKASFENHGERMVITFPCVNEAGQWLVADVTYADGTSLVKLLSPAK